jgi:hypothetical protein
MEREQLKKTLQQLHRELGQQDHIDPEIHALLATLDEDIHKLVSEDPSEVKPAGVMDNAEQLAARYAAGHPRTEALLRELVNALARMGV